MMIASYGRANEWAGTRSGLTHPVSMAVVSSSTVWHQSSRVAATVRSPFIASQRLDAASPLPDIVARLNQIQPDVLIAYASMIKALAYEQLSGRLDIAPRAVNSSSEVLTADARAWRCVPGRCLHTMCTRPPRPAASQPNAITTAACTSSRTSSFPRSSTTTTTRFRPADGRSASGHRAVQPDDPAHPLRVD